MSPADKGGGDVLPVSTRSFAAVEGNASTFASLTAFGDPNGTGVSTEYMAERTAVPGTHGWKTHAITPAQDPLALFVLTNTFESKYEAELSPDLSTGVFRAWTPLTDDPAVAPVENLYVRSDLRSPGRGTYSLVTGCPGCGGTPLVWGGHPSEIPFMAGASADFRHVLFESSLNLTGDGAGPAKLYASDDGNVRLVGLVPGGSDVTCGGAGPACVLPADNSGGSIAGQGATTRHYTLGAISADGSRVNFTAPTAANNFPIEFGSGPDSRSKLYQRDTHGTASTADDTTVRLNVSERTLTRPDPLGALYQGASSDGTRVFFTSEALSDDALAGPTHLYMWDAQHVNDEMQRLTVAASGGTLTLTFDGQTTSPLAFDASASTVAAALNGLSSIAGAGGTVTVTGGPGDDGGSAPYLVTFRGALSGADQPLMTADGAGLTGTAPAATVDPQVAGGGRLTLIDRDHQPADAPSDAVGVIGASDDGSFVYFVADSQLVAGQPSLSGGAHGIYLWHDGELRFIGSLAGTTSDASFDIPSGLPYNSHLLDSRVTSDGHALLFSATDGSGLTGYDHNTSGCGPFGGNSCTEYYLYDADSGTLTCATCNPDAPKATGDASIATVAESGAASSSAHLSHALSANGRRVFFTSTEALVPADTNGRSDAYEYDAATRRISLISSGKSTSNSYFMDASADGRDVFFLTRERLVGWDVDAANDLYDARVGGGLPDPVPDPPLCSGSACQGPLVGPPSGLSFGSSLLTTNTGNLKPVSSTKSSKHLTRSQKLKRALRACKSRHKKGQHKKCESAARRRFGKSGGSK